jgi:ATP-binding cassette, subfamily C (CFTR/MRP), member 10
MISIVSRGQAISRVTQRQMSFKDRRVQTCDEMLHGIRTLKLLAWEEFLASQLGRLRLQEMSYLSQRKYLDAGCVYFWAATPVLTALSTFTVRHPGGHALVGRCV